mmetsp:Transcript_30878/g.51652  ORF Transcript_30878/g.51652 Transcript_30878/m.51652 type:complete len:154 (+) Transcript_30878:496-957(+)
MRIAFKFFSMGQRAFLCYTSVIVFVFYTMVALSFPWLHIWIKFGFMLLTSGLQLLFIQSAENLIATTNNSALVAAGDSSVAQYRGILYLQIIPTCIATVYIYYHSQFGAGKENQLDFIPASIAVLSISDILLFAKLVVIKQRSQLVLRQNGLM